MHGSRKRKFELALPRVDALRALAELTAQADQGVLVIGEETVELADCASLKISVKHLGVSSLLKVSLKYPALGPDALPRADETGEDGAVDESGDVPGPDGLPRYKGLKKRMKHSFKAVVAALRVGLAPDAAVAASFVADSRLMTRYPGKGDAYYAVYDAEVDRFEQALAAGDVAALTASAAALDRLKKECHSRHA
jgi:XXXCH domain-containing protein